MRGKKKNTHQKEDKRNLLAFFNMWTLSSILIQLTLNQRFQSQTLLACLFNHISGRYSFPAKLDFVFIGFLKSLLSLTLQSSIPFHYLRQNKPSHFHWSWCHLCSEFIRDWVVRQDFCLYFLVLNIVLQLRAVLKHTALTSGRGHSSLNAVQYISSASVCDLAWSQLCSVPCLHSRRAVAGLRIQNLLVSITAVPSFLLLLFFSPAMDKIPTITWSVPQYWIIWRADPQRYPEANVKKPQNQTPNSDVFRSKSLMAETAETVAMVFLTSRSQDWFLFRSLNIKYCCHIICTYFVLTIISLFQHY